MALRFGDQTHASQAGLVYDDPVNFVSGADKSGFGAMQAQAAAVVGTGTRGVQDLGTIPDLAAQSATVAGVAEEVQPGTGDAVAQAAAVVGTGVIYNYITGAGVLVAGTASAAGTGRYGIGGLGILEAQAATVTGLGTLEGKIFGIGASAAQPAAVVGVGERIITGAGMLVPNSMLVAGQGTVINIAVDYVCFLPPNTLPLEALSMSVSYAQQFSNAPNAPTSVTVGWDDLVTYHAGNPPETEVAYEFSNDKTFVEDQE